MMCHISAADLSAIGFLDHGDRVIGLQGARREWRVGDRRTAGDANDRGKKKHRSQGTLHV